MASEAGCRNSNGLVVAHTLLVARRRYRGRGAQAAMPEQQLDGAQVGVGYKQVDGKRMTHGVGRHRLGNRGPAAYLSAPGQVSNPPKFLTLPFAAVIEAECGSAATLAIVDKLCLIVFQFGGRQRRQPAAFVGISGQGGRGGATNAYR